MFVIHGRNLEARKQIGYFLAALGLEAVDFDDLRASLGGTPTIAEIVTVHDVQSRERCLLDSDGVLVPR